VGITLVIVGGLALMTLFAAGFDYLGKKKGRNDTAMEQRVAVLEKKAEELEKSLMEKENKIGALEGNVSFMNRLLEDKSK